MIAPQLHPPDGSSASSRIRADGSGLHHDVNNCIADWKSKLLEAGLADSVSPNPPGVHRPPEVSGFQCIGWLGSGASGEVWLADDLEADRTVALKVMHHRHTGGTSADLFQREFRLLAKMRQPNLVLLYKGVVTSDGRHGLAMEWIDGWPLDEWLESHPDLSLEDKLQLFRGIVAGVAYLHENGVIHRDLKPANVIVDAQGVARIVDFGLARLHHEGATGGTDGGSIGVAGTLHFMAPEQAADSEGARAMPVDVFALGLLLYRILSGEWLRSPEKTPAETLALVLNPPPFRLPESARHLPTDLQSILRRTLAADPAHRYRHARELEADLKNFSAKLPVSARNHTFVYLTITLLRRQARRSALAAAVVVAGLILGGMIQQGHREVARKNEANLQHAYTLTSYTLSQLSNELRNASPQIDIASPDMEQALPQSHHVLLPVNKIGELDLRYYQAQLADLRSATSEVRSHHASALKSIESALDLYSELSKESPDDPQRLLDAARTRLSFARLLSRVGRDEGAGDQAEKVIRQLDRLVARHGGVSSELLPLRCDAIGFLARQAHCSGDGVAAYKLIQEKLALCKASEAGLQTCPKDGVSPRLAVAADDLATYALEGGPHCIPTVMAAIAEVTETLRSEYNRNPDSISMASGLARCIHATARIHLQFGPVDDLEKLYGEAADLLIHRPSKAKHLLFPLVWEISRSATEWAGAVLEDPDPAVPASAVNLAQQFTVHLRQNGFELDAIISQRARIYLYQSQLACRAQDRTKGARLISRALGIVNNRHVMRGDDLSLALMAARIMHQARSLSDQPDAKWNEEREQRFHELLKSFDGFQGQLTPLQKKDLDLMTHND